MNRNVMKVSAIAGLASLAVLTTGPALAAGPVSRATAQALTLSLGGTNAVSQTVVATNDGKSEQRSDASTLPTLADLIRGNNAAQAGVAPQNAGATVDGDGNGTSFACAGLAGPGGGIAYVGDTSCTIKGDALSLDLGSLDLDLTHLLGDKGAISGPLKPVLDTLGLGGALDDVVSQLTGALAGTPLGQIRLSGGLSAVSAMCTTTPTGAKGDAEILDTSGDRRIPIAVTIPNGTGGTQELNLADLDVDVAPKPGGTDVLVSLDSVTQALIDALSGEVQTVLGGAIADLDDPVVKGLVQTAQGSLITPLVTALRPALEAISDNLLKIVVNDRSYADDGRSVEVTTLRLEVLGAAKQFTGAGLVEGRIGHVTCGPNGRVAAPTAATPTPSPTPHHPSTPDIPRHVDSGLAGSGQGGAGGWIAATTALLALAAAGGTLAYRRFGMPRG